MIALSRLLAGGELRAAPERAVAVAILLAVAGVLPAVLGVSTGVGAVLAATLAVAATTGAAAAHERRQQTLEVNGSGAAAVVAVAVATMAMPALLATVAVTVVAAASVALSIDPRPDAFLSVAVCFAIPLLAAAATALFESRSPSGGPRRGRTLAWALAVAAAVVLAPIVALPLGLFALGRALRRRGRIGSVLTGLAAVVGAGLIASVVGRISGWFLLALALLVLGPILAVAVARLGGLALDLVSTAVGRAGPRARLAAAPLHARRRALGPVAAVLTVITALAAMDGTVGASFERREERARATAIDYDSLAGSAPDQATAGVSWADPIAVRLVAADVARRRGVHIVVIETLGDDVVSGFLTTEREIALSPQYGGRGPRGVGVIAPFDLAALGFGELAAALDRGEVAVVNPTYAAPVELDDAEGPGAVDRLTMRTLDPPRTRMAALFPGAFVSRARARATGEPIWADSVVAVPNGSAPVDGQGLRAAAEEVRARFLDADGRPPITDESLETGRDIGVLGWSADAQEPVRMGDDPLTLDDVGALNEVPILSGTLAAARGRMVVLGALAVLVALAGAVLALGWTRAEDAVLDLQGATTGLRVALGALQALMLAGSASLVAAAAGIGLPALSIWVYDDQARRDLPPIPLVVPTEVIIGLALLPLMAAALTALAVALRRGPDASTLQHDLAW